jgi:RNA polymerase sigma-70 factor, ECF subfamily
VAEEALIDRLKRRDEAAFREVLERYGDALYAYVFNLTHDAHLSEDVVSDTYLRLVEHIDSYIYTGVPLKSWLYRVAHNTALNALQRAERTRTAGDTGLDLAMPSADPAATVAAQLDAEDLRCALGSLTDEQRQVLLLRFGAELSSAEVAQVVEKSETAVRQLQVRALRALGRLLQQEV